MNSIYYLPILKARSGEFKALSNLRETQKDLIAPLLEVTNMEFDFEEGAKPKVPKTIENHLERFCDKLKRKWGRSNCFVDSDLVNNVEIPGTSCLELIYDDLKKVNVLPIPVIRASADIAFCGIVAKILRENSINEVAIRATPEDVTSPDFRENLDNILTTIAVPPANCHFVLDLKDSDFSATNEIAEAVMFILENFPHFNEWKAFTVSAGAFPSTGKIKATVSQIPRYDWMFFKSIRTKLRSKPFARQINFGDYSIVASTYLKFDPRKMSSSANIRYTLDDHWLVLKGKALKTSEDFKQYVSQAKEIVKSGFFMGEKFSAGDNHFLKCIKGEVKPGNSTVWNWVGNNHHFTKVLSDLFSTPAGS
jgi:hypothetical protein